jgi:hypothetical protein
MSFSTKAIKYFLNLITPKTLTNGVGVINPYKSPEVRKAVRNFYNRFYKDDKKRIYMIGINPGRFGGGLTGIAFTDPTALKENCGIENNLGNKKELSSEFIYKVISSFGGADTFFSKIFLTALYPFALVKDGKNFNYYDDKKLFLSLKSDIINSLQAQINFGANRETVIILGQRNAAFFKSINEDYKFFNKIFVLDHPRYIMQYRRRTVNNYISQYINSFL